MAIRPSGGTATETHWKSTLRLTFYSPKPRALYYGLAELRIENLSCSIYPICKYVTVAPIPNRNSRRYLTLRRHITCRKCCKIPVPSFQCLHCRAIKEFTVWCLYFKTAIIFKKKSKYLSNSSPASYEALFVSLVSGLCTAPVTAALCGILSYWIAL